MHYIAYVHDDSLRVLIFTVGDSIANITKSCLVQKGMPTTLFFYTTVNGKAGERLGMGLEIGNGDRDWEWG